ncbi:zinc finger protein 618-like [Misgurnus anguillicaudatus]|uniref:zinc finger protein 618-like n=1 Tax=Misgurnus anguillicaudatus TaxID=75329 RepID=UPI003CCF8C44
MTMSSLKEKCLKILNEKFELHLLHKLAMFLHPKLKSLKLLADHGEIMGVHSEARRLVKELEEKREDLPDRSISAAPAAKRARSVSVDCLVDVEDSSDDTVPPDDEVSAYIEFKPPKGNPFDVLWWKEHAKTFPNLAMIARNILSIPAMSAASERDFSTAGFVIQERRTQLKPGTVDDILFLHSNLKGK